MPKKKRATSDDDKELEEWIVEAHAESLSRWAPPLEDSLGVRPSDEDIWCIAGKAKDYVDIHRRASKVRDWSKACARVEKAAEKFKEALVDSAKYNGNLINAWQKEPSADKVLVRVQRLASELPLPRERKKPSNRPLRSLIAAVLEASHNAGKKGLGIKTDPDTGKLAGHVLDAVKTSLMIAGVSEHEMPGDNTIRQAARDVNREGK